MSVAALVLAAGRGERLGSPLPKAFVQVAGQPLLAHALAALARSGGFTQIVPVVPAPELSRMAGLAGLLTQWPEVTDAVAGGAERQDSMRAGLAALRPGVEIVAIHDAARPLVPPDAVRRVLAAAAATGAALLAVPVTDTIKRVRGGRVLETPDRAECWAAQTPQAFRLPLLCEAVARADVEGFVATDDAQLVERLGHPVAVVEGHPDNFKVTRRDDLARAETLLARRAGQAA